MKNKLDLSIVVPVYGCIKSLAPLLERTTKALDNQNIDWELILVNDGSKDDAWKKISELAGLDSRVSGVDLSRNFGQHAAITAGLSLVKGDRIIVMDCDLQDRPEEIPTLYSKAKEGYEVVLARRHDRKDKFLKKLSSRIFYSFLSWLTDQEYDPAIANFGCYDRKVIEAVLNVGDKARSFPLFVRWVGFKTVTVDVQHEFREFGQTTYTFRKSISFALNSMLSFSDRLLKITAKIGLFISVISGVAALYYFIGAVRGIFEVQGWATLVISIWMLGGINILIVGIVGLYISRIFEQTKDRPIFIIRDIVNK